ncbi:MAG: aminoacyl-tRNA hydrolase [Planctomycetes bacterium]|jgi:PTH1 family peptidyl-tRNA hydrolase|nr:aminoacyl-tRNA hydrolase [Planctomycetota bacterium]MBT4028858.1 aminoacyl-tRNA hydrolase [Planctomycetota bacterium]MBT4559582.1 aminoacyl-tRNA hydrolase [Planctomycetota bacterium]MBT5100306.1 aminoacyl-tRNA hydrolase [Planctomycetota bacterium]MBT7012866.1 aminoacyl-tRNA hydrolase [Planctomycetota bacterium]
MIFGPKDGTTLPDLGPRLIVGLGNPGAEYDGTRHNVGFQALDLFAKRVGLTSSNLRVAGRKLADLARSTDGRFALLWPTTYMNLSGSAVAAAARQLDVLPESILVVTDDFHLELGGLRIRAAGSPGGHNGLKSIEQVLQTDLYPRLRIGVGQPRASSVDHVLETFRSAELPIVEETLETASWALEDWALGQSIEDVQSRYNRRTPQANSE